jgi:hypothetical protein
VIHQFAEGALVFALTLYEVVGCNVISKKRNHYDVNWWQIKNAVAAF